MNPTGPKTWLEAGRVPGVCSRVSDNECAAIVETAAARGFRVVSVDLAEVDGKPALLEKLARELSFPAYFGHNWDALADALGDLSWHQAPGVLLVLENTAGLQHGAPEDFATLLAILKEAADAHGLADVLFRVLVTVPEAWPPGTGRNAPAAGATR